MFSTMVVPLDGSEVAEAALGYAALLPSERVRLLRVESVTGANGEAREYLERHAEDLRQQGRKVNAVVVQGDPAEQIVSQAGDADLIVMTTAGRGAGSRALFGSVADRVVRHAGTPTLVIRAGRLPGPPQVARIVVPLDGSTLSTRALEMAEKTAILLGVPAHLVHVVDVDPVRDSVRAGSRAAAAELRSQNALAQTAEQHLQEQAARLQSQVIRTTTEIRRGQPAAELLDLIVPTDLVVMTTHGRSGVQRWLLGSVADKLVHHAAAPVLLVRP